ncbi:uncharacterized protein LOC107767985 [Nicotiana tabacum]|uniref:Uncharacterized protein LOC107767985 n=1 Tax=Nicotiana tabacum TaxID=4097 RepID=A0AC58TGB3_TOBAC
MNDKEYPLWSRCNDMVTSWLLNSLTKEIGDNVIYYRTAKDLWNSLEHRFGQSSGAKLHHLQKEISKTCQGNNNISSYFTTLKRQWDELDSLNSHLGCNSACVCDGKKKMAKFMEDQRVIQFLMGLNDTYAQARGNILMLSPMPSIDQCTLFFYKMRAKGKSIQVHNTPLMGLHSCHCSKIGHVRGDCYRLVGFPDEFQFTKGGNFQGTTIKTNVVITDQQTDGKYSEDNEGSQNSQPQFSSKEQVPLMRRGQVFGEVRDGLYLL